MRMLFYNNIYLFIIITDCHIRYCLKTMYFTHIFIVCTEGRLCFLQWFVLWRWKTLWPFHLALARTFDNTVTGVCTHTHAPAHFHFKHSFPFPPHLWRTRGALFKRKQRQTHKCHLTCLNRLAIHFTASLAVTCLLICVHPCFCNQLNVHAYLLTWLL